MRKLTILIALGVVLLLGLSACGSGGESSDDTRGGDSTKASPAVVAKADSDKEVSPASTPAAVDVEVSVAEEVVEPEPEIPELYLEVVSPADESVVSASEVRVEGRTISTAIVSVNGVLTSVDAEGAFALNTTLDVGPNFIEVVTSDLSGEEIGQVLTLVYLPS